MVLTSEISLQSKGYCDITDITQQVAKQVTETNLSNGIVALFISGSTAGISTIEFEPGLISDLQSMW